MVFSLVACQENVTTKDEEANDETPSETPDEEEGVFSGYETLKYLYIVLVQTNIVGSSSLQIRKLL